VLIRTSPARAEQYVAIATELVSAFFAEEGAEISEPHTEANKLLWRARWQLDREKAEVEKEEEERRMEEEERVMAEMRRKDEEKGAMVRLDRFLGDVEAGKYGGVR
jgi:hypothetical protein